MKTLIYIPVIHTDPDLGSLVSDVEEKASGLLGERWKEHKRTVDEYWKEITKYLENKRLKGVKIFQDSLPVGETEAQTIVNKLAERGSPNYRLLKKLSRRGAILVKTEDPALLKQEYQLTRQLIAKKPLLLAIFNFFNYKLKENKLLEARDSYIANQINQELGREETGVCFLGAYHRVLSKLAKDIKVLRFKDPDKVKNYYRALSANLRKKTSYLARYLTKPVKSGKRI